MTLHDHGPDPATEAFLARLRAAAEGPGPQPSAELAALLPDLGEAAPTRALAPPRPGRTPRRIIATCVVAGLTGALLTSPIGEEIRDYVERTIALARSYAQTWPLPHPDVPVMATPAPTPGSPTPAGVARSEAAPTPRAGTTAPSPNEVSGLRHAEPTPAPPVAPPPRSRAVSLQPAPPQIAPVDPAPTEPTCPAPMAPRDTTPPNPKSETPQANPKAERPQANPKAETPQANPKAEKPQANPKAGVPQANPKAGAPQANPRSLERAPAKQPAPLAEPETGASTAD